MTLSFSTKWPERMGAKASESNYFIEKIYQSIWPLKNNDEYFDLRDWHCLQFGCPWDGAYPKTVGFRKMAVPKLHTVRAGNRWKAGNKIHPVINNRTVHRFQFAPTMICTSVQEIEIKFAYPHRYIFIDGKYIDDYNTKLNIAVNDGFNSVEDFFAYFNEDFKGQLVHWTDLRY